MPHAENTMVNGDNSSQFLSHLESYPAVTDSINAVKSNPYGQKSLDIADAGYKNFVAPVVPYAQRPYGYVAPYVNKADQLADGVLNKADEKFPVLKEDTEKLKGSIVDLAFFPLRLVGQSKDYALDTYANEYKKCGGDGYIAGSKAVVTSGLVMTSDAFAWLASYLGHKKQQAHDMKEQAKGAAKEKKEQAKETAKDKTGN